MPRVHTKTKAKAGQRYDCGRCGKQITPGTKYYEWSFRYGGTRRQHEACGYPRSSQLTQSKLSSVYAAIEDAEDTIGKAKSPEDIAAALDSAAETAREIAQEYQDAVEAMGAAGEGSESNERADALESFADELESASSDIASDEDPPEGEEGAEETADERIERLREQASAALGELML